MGSVGPDILAFTAAGLAPGTDYFYSVCAFNGAGESCSSAVAGRTQSPPTAATPTPPPATTKIVDDKAMTYNKAASGWKRQKAGAEGGSYWTTVQKTKARHKATWSASLDAPGRYHVWVIFPKTNATTRSARYTVLTATGSVTRRLDQAKMGGRWVALGTYEFGTLAEVRLTDKTGERTSSGRRIAFDTVKFVPVEVAVAALPTAEPALQPGAVPPVAPPGSMAVEPTFATEPTPAPEVEAEPADDTQAEPTPKAESEPEADAGPTPASDEEPTREPELKTAEPEPTPGPELRSKADPEETAEPAPTPEPEPQAEARKEPRADSEAAPAPEPEPKAADPEATPEGGPRVESQPEPEPMEEPKAEREPKPKAKPEQEPEPKAEAKPEQEPEPKAEAEPKQEPKAEREPKPKAEPEAKQGPKPEPQPGPTAQPPAEPGNQPPTADAGPIREPGAETTPEQGPDRRYQIDEGGFVELDGSGSSDPDGSIVAYQWTREQRLDDATAKRPLFAAVDDGLFEIELTVTDDQGASSTDSAEIRVHNVDPRIAELGPFTVSVGEEIVLSGIVIRDPGPEDTHELSLDWGDGTSSAATVHEDRTASAGHVYATPGEYVITLTVRDDDGGTGDRETVVSVLAVTAEEPTVIEGETAAS